jgi:hypothetical protein
MAKNLKQKTLEIGTRFKKGVVTLVLVKIERGMAIFQRSRRGNTILFEVVALSHIKNCPSVYQRIEEEISL